MLLRVSKLVGDAARRLARRCRWRSGCGSVAFAILLRVQKIAQRGLLAVKRRLRVDRLVVTVLEFAQRDADQLRARGSMGSNKSRTSPVVATSKACCRAIDPRCDMRNEKCADAATTTTIERGEQRASSYRVIGPLTLPD